MTGTAAIVMVREGAGSCTGRMLADRGMAGGQRMAIVLVEQFYDFAAELADQYLVMERGEIIQRGRGATMEADGARRLVSI